MWSEPGPVVTARWLARFRWAVVAGATTTLMIASNWLDVSAGAFAAVTARDYGRLLSASSTTALRRYVRYNATRTGGSAGDGITFALAIARSNQ